MTTTQGPPTTPPTGTINFYRTSGPFGEFSNFFRAPIELFGKVWPTSEHLFQAAKFFHTDPEWAEAIRLAPSPGECAVMGRDRSHKMIDPAWWDSVGRLEMMRHALLLKFTSHPRLMSLLKSTGDRLLVEHTEKDSYWGDGGDGSGENMLGRMLMEFRSLFLNAGNDTAMMLYFMAMSRRLIGLEESQPPKEK